jgi:hypothetical protein
MTKPQISEKAETFVQFWRHYLLDHAQAGTRLLHFLSTGLAVAALILSTVTLDPMIAILGSGFAGRSMRSGLGRK